MLQDMIPGTEELLNKEMVRGYIGFDPTADSLGVGNLVQVMMLLHFQQAGHKPIALIGGATGMVGDPSGKSQERNLLSEDILQHNLNCQKKQLEKFLDFNCGEQSAEIVNNYDWFKELNFLDFIRDIGKHISINYMLAKDSVQSRLATGMSFTEFSYQLVQGFDFYHLWKNKNVKLQMGGSDQWGNIVTGTELIRRKEGGEAFALTTPLIKKADGTKFGKTEEGNVWLDAGKTSPYQFYQFWLNASDEDAEKWIKIFTFLSKDAVNMLIHEQQENPSARVLQKKLAREITVFVHGEEEFNKAIETTEKLFANKNASAESLSIDDLENMEGVLKIDFSKDKILSGIEIVSFLAESGIFTSKGEARKMVQGGGISINRKKADSIEMNINSSFLLHNKYILVQKGKKNYYLINLL